MAPKRKATAKPSPPPTFTPRITRSSARNRELPALANKQKQLPKEKNKPEGSDVLPKAANEGTKPPSPDPVLTDAAGAITAGGQEAAPSPPSPATKKQKIIPKENDNAKESDVTAPVTTGAVVDTALLPAKKRKHFPAKNNRGNESTRSQEAARSPPLPSPAAKKQRPTEKNNEKNNENNNEKNSETEPDRPIVVAAAAAESSGTDSSKTASAEVGIISGTLGSTQSPAASEGGSSGLIVQRRKAVHFNVTGQPIGQGSAEFVTYLGTLARAHCPIYLESWRDMPMDVRDSLWMRVTNMYSVSESYRELILKKMSTCWRQHKHDLRKKYYDKYDTNEKKRMHCPVGVKAEDWDKFVVVQLTPAAQERRKKGKAARSEMKSPHTSGRRGAARTAEYLRQLDPNSPVTRTAVYLATHTRKDGSCPSQELESKLDKIRAIASNDPSSTGLDIDCDPVAQVCGSEGKGRVRGLGNGVSRRMLRSSAPAREHLREEQSVHDSLYEMINSFNDRMKAQEQLITEMRKQLSNQTSQPQVVSGLSSSQGTTPLPLRSAAPAEPLLPLRSAAPAEPLPVERPCELLHVGMKVVGVGRVLIGEAAPPPPTDFYRVIVDLIHDPTAPLFIANSSLLLGDMRGVVVNWPRGLICFTS